MKDKKQLTPAGEKPASAMNQDMKPSDYIKGTSGDEVRPVKRGFYGEFFNWLGMALTKLLLKVEVRGLENLPEDAPYILAPNHETYVDGLWVGGYLSRSHFNRYACLAAKDLLTDHGAFGRLIMQVGRGIPLDRRGNPLHGMKLAIKQVKDGNILMVHPEGTRTRNGKLGKIQEGAAFISRHSGAPIVPVFLDGGYEIFNRHMKWPSWWDKENRRRRRLIVTYGKPFDPANYKNVKTLTADLATWMEEQFAAKEVPRVL